ncbi:MAG: hypothetical protein IPI57_11135 [Candidatus Competibacteraceae bacterium]|nr:hypothetical protein [Candidatus Competibacteraceae bacterium]
MTVVVLDTTVLLLLLDPNAHPPTDPDTGKPLQWCRERMECLLDHFEKTKTVALIPTPVLCEVLVGARDADAFIREIRKAPVFDIADFDAASAIAAADFIRGWKRHERNLMPNLGDRQGEKRENDLHRRQRLG